MTFSFQSVLAQTTHDWLQEKILPESVFGELNDWLTDTLLFIGVLIVAFLFYFITKRIVVRVATNFVKKTKNNWDDEVLNSRLFTWVSSLVPIIVLWQGGLYVFRSAEVDKTLNIFGEVSVIILSFCCINSLLNVAERIYRRFEVSKQVPVKSFIQVTKIILLICAVIFSISSIVGGSPMSIFTGLGAMTAILMLVFKDSILGLVAGVQLSANRMVARGDWVEMPKFGADGEVLEVALTTVKVRNWDKTITTLPTYALISDSFKNWRGMSGSGVRRIKRALNIDLSSVGFVDETMLGKLKQFHLLNDYLAEKETELTEWNAERNLDPNDVFNARVLTNVGTFRAYVIAYLQEHKKISNDETLLVRQLQPTEHGLPIEIYVFTNDNRWVEFEGIQSDIFDHLIAVLPEFGLRVFQRPSGADFSKETL